MQASNDPERVANSRRAHALVTATLVSVVLVAGCGGSHGTTAASTGAATTSASGAATGGAGTSSQSPVPAGTRPSGLAFSRCMRANGVPNFPDPSPGGGLMFSTARINPAAPAVIAAHAKCQKLLPGGGPPGPGATTHPSAQTLSELLRIAKCMHAHGVSDFPEPMTSVPHNPFGGGPGEITDYDGAILLFPATLNQQAPAYRQAVAACGVLAGKLGSGPHS